MRCRIFFFARVVEIFLALPPNFQLWIIHMAGYRCSRLRKRSLRQKNQGNTNDEYELFTWVRTKCVVTFVLR